MECNNALAYVCDLKGALTDITLQWDGKQLVLTEQETHNGTKSIWQEAFSEITTNSFTQTGDYLSRSFPLRVSRLRPAWAMADAPFCHPASRTSKGKSALIASPGPPWIRLCYF
jgi:hypothetical protein